VLRLAVEFDPTGRAKKSTMKIDCDEKVSTNSVFLAASQIESFITQYFAHEHISTFIFK
jgi:hypothetical protein